MKRKLTFLEQLKNIVSTFADNRANGTSSRLNFKHYLEGKKSDASNDDNQDTPNETDLGFDKVAVAYTAQKVRVPIEAFVPKDKDHSYDPDKESEPRKLKHKIFPGGGPIITPNTEPIIEDEEIELEIELESKDQIESEIFDESGLMDATSQAEEEIDLHIERPKRNPDPSTVLKQPVFSRVQAFMHIGSKKNADNAHMGTQAGNVHLDTKDMKEAKEGKNNPKKQNMNSEQSSLASSSRVYADYASLTPIDDRVKKVMIEAMDLYPANPSSLYAEGVASAKALTDARTSIAGFFGAHKQEVIFTSGGTESNNLVFSGVLDAALNSGIERPHFIVSTIEHPSIIEIALDFVTRGYDVSFVPVDENGLINPKDIKKALRDETVLISIIYANNEIGTVQPIKEIAREVRHFKKSLGRGTTDFPYIHTDACQAVLYEDMRIPGLNIDFMSVDGGKIYGPRGAGVLIKKRTAQMGQLMYGGGQEFGLRPGTENLVSVIGLKHAFDIAHSERDDEIPRLRELQSTCIDMISSKLADILPGMKINGTLDERLPNNINICFPGIDAEFLVLRLDVLGVAVSSVTSCRASNEDSSSYVIEALGRPDCAQSSLRITLGRYTTAVDVALIAEKVVQAVAEQVNQRGKGRR